ncbi:hypothetical protein [Serratia fonticola]|uniref:hypothetical protein n=1 Tax=Serratia fonticola TaxID=47917 RepID=UPI0021BDCB2B|nr:hypothetical protein [Serratia fonticola]
MAEADLINAIVKLIKSEIPLAEYHEFNESSEVNMDVNGICEKIKKLSASHFVKTIATLPDDINIRTQIFIETLRLTDYLSVVQSLFPKEMHLPYHTYECIKYGENKIMELTFSKVEIEGWFPLHETSDEKYNFCFSLAYNIGLCVLCERIIEMLNTGLFSARITDGEITISGDDDLYFQIHDHFDYNAFLERKKELLEKIGRKNKGWYVDSITNVGSKRNLVGAFQFLDDHKELDEFVFTDIEAVMKGLIKPWNSGRGIMTSYETSPELDNHFLYEATILVEAWVREIGFYSGVSIGGVKGYQLLSIITIVVSLHLKHIRFCLCASSLYPDISFRQSLSVWCPIRELEEDIIYFSGLNKEIVSKCLDIIMIHPGELDMLKSLTRALKPLLIDLGNGVLIKPVSSLSTNVLVSIIRLQEFRDKKTINILAKDREDLLRDEIYALFQGNKYMHVDGNVKIRDGNKVVTDIDGAIYDKVTGELAIFQLKWQDYFTNNVRALRSKAKNLSSEMDSWADKICLWIDSTSSESIVKSLRLKLPKNKKINKVYLFGISKAIANTRGYGFSSRNKNLAIGNIYNFTIARLDCEPFSSVFSTIHERIVAEYNDESKYSGLPISIELQNCKINFENFWYKL